ncbi:MAG: hypothetical protein HGB12_07325 [Bacteroidetes bacterium]|nr:hypothetical protein [Bacteroidota bacterium]
MKKNRIINIISNIFKTILPKNKIGDNIYSYIKFLFIHKRVPTNKKLFNDVLYKIKTTEEIDDALRAFVSDKEYLKIFVKSVIGDIYVVPTLAILKNAVDVNEYLFPEKCCIKPTHASGKVFLRSNNEKIDYKEIKSWLQIKYYEYGRERNYKYLKPKIIVEPIVFDEKNPMDYKFYCYNGTPKIIQIDIDRYINHTRLYYNMKWELLNFSIIYPKSHKTIDKPKNIIEMIDIATSLCKYFNFVRIDIYSNGEHCMVGEITHCAENASGRFIPKKSELYMSKICFSNKL